MSRVDSGLPTTFRLDPATGEATAIGSPGTWLPSVSPTGTVAGWWSGTLKKAADGVTWVPDQGQLVLGAWPSTSLPGGASEVPSQIPFQVASQIPSQVASQIPSQMASQIPSQVLATIPLDAWQVRWDDTGAVVAVWVGEGDGRNGRLSLYQLDETTGVPDLANPTLNAVPANPDFSLRAGRLAWTTPDLGDGAPRTVHVPAWWRDGVPADGAPRRRERHGRSLNPTPRRSSALSRGALEGAATHHRLPRRSCARRGMRYCPRVMRRRVVVAASALIAAAALIGLPAPAGSTVPSPARDAPGGGLRPGAHTVWRSGLLAGVGT